MSKNPAINQFNLQDYFKPQNQDRIVVGCKNRIVNQSVNETVFLI